jgi:hypothetical protein
MIQINTDSLFYPVQVIDYNDASEVVVLRPFEDVYLRPGSAPLPDSFECSVDVYFASLSQTNLSRNQV